MSVMTKELRGMKPGTKLDKKAKKAPKKAAKAKKKSY